MISIGIPHVPFNPIVMLESFERYTGELNEQEKKIFPLFVQCLKRHIGKSSAISNSVISEKLLVHMGIKLHGSRVRKMINIIQNEGLIPHLVSCGKGYYVAETREDVVRYVASIRARSNSIYDVARAVARDESIQDHEIAKYNKEYYEV